MCRRCLDVVETQDHLFFQCVFAQQVWSICHALFRTHSWPRDLHQARDPYGRFGGGIGSFLVVFPITIGKVIMEL